MILMEWPDIYNKSAQDEPLAANMRVFETRGEQKQGRVLLAANFEGNAQSAEKN